MKRTIFICLAVLVIAVGAAAVFGGLRIIAIGPMGDEAGRTVIVVGLNDVSYIDSPETYCAHQGDGDATCPISFRLAIAREGSVILTLPYSETLHGLAGKFQ